MNERLVEPERTREEMLRGKKLIAMPANERHARQHTRLDYLVYGLVNADYQGATDMLTRVSNGSDFATDTAICKKGIDPKTGRRFLEEISFEIVDAQTDNEIQERAEDLIARGVRRVFAVFAREKTMQVCEWSIQKNSFEPLGLDDEIDDPVFVKPLRVRAILDEMEAKNEVARSLSAQKNPVIEEGKREAFTEGEREGEREGHRNVLLLLLKQKFGDVPAQAREQVLSADSEQLTAWISRVLAAPTLDAVLL